MPLGVPSLAALLLIPFTYLVFLGWPLSRSTHDDANHLPVENGSVVGDRDKEREAVERLEAELRKAEEQRMLAQEQLRGEREKRRKEKETVQHLEVKLRDANTRFEALDRDLQRSQSALQLSQTTLQLSQSKLAQQEEHARGLLEKNRGLETNLRETDVRLQGFLPELDASRSSLLRPASTLTEQQLQIQELLAKNKDLDANLHEATVRIRDLDRTLENAQSALSHSEDLRSQQELQIKGLQKSVDQKTALLDTRAKELAEAQVFLGTQDAITDTEVVHLMQELNYEIQQVAMTLADVVVEEMDAVPQRSIEPAVVDDVRVILGDRMVETLQSVQHAEDPLMLELAFQAAIASVCRVVISRWHFGPSHQEPFSRTFESVFLAEPAAVSGRWRSLTRRYAQATFHTDVPPTTPAVGAFISTLVSIIILAGFGTSSDAVQTAVISHVGKALSEIATVALRLNITIGEEILSSALAPTISIPGSAFDVKNMENAYSNDASTSDTVRVLCTTSLGLERRVRRDDGTVEKTDLARPKVALENVVEVLGVFADGEADEEEDKGSQAGRKSDEQGDGDAGSVTPQKGSIPSSGRAFVPATSVRVA